MLISNNCFICLYVFWGISSHSKNFSLKWRRHHYGKFYFDLCSALMVIGLWRFFSVPHLLWHGVSIYNGHLAPRTRDTHNFCRVFASGAVTTCFYDFDLLRWDSNTQPSACGANALTDCATAVVNCFAILYASM